MAHAGEKRKRDNGNGSNVVGTIKHPLSGFELKAVSSGSENCNDAVINLENTPFQTSASRRFHSELSSPVSSFLKNDPELKLQLKNDIYAVYNLSPSPELNDPNNWFVLIADFKWNQKQVEDLYLIAICHQHDIRSLRDLTEDHLPLLKNILEEGKEAILKRYGIHENKLRIYLHYQPSYFHLHVHFTVLGQDAPGSFVEHAHLLCDVIQNIESNPQYYQTRTLTFALREHEALLKKFKELRDI
ncbi:hypothetical protein XELAEV_18037321mg [Xenopus laevis]|uniref:m7GpppX diphosphatase n=1 Tax=Xenopus laevis TaxID=8355 RepID=A0A974CC33_XENLA|nr:hypothetical protein XELAEV_18037321mg [Xenopus laevis]